MSRRLVLFPTIGFGVAFIAAATLQPVIGSFNKAFHFEGATEIASASEEQTATPVRGGAHPILTPTLPPLQASLAGVTSGGATPAAPDSTATAGPSSTATARTSTPPATSTRVASAATATKTAAPPSATPSATATHTGTPAPTQTATSSPTATATADPCGPARDAALAFQPASQTLRTSNAIAGHITLTNTGRQGWGRSLVLRITVPAGARYLTRLTVQGQAPLQDAAAPSLEVRLGDLGPGQELRIDFEAVVAWPAANTTTLAAAPALDLRFEVVADACRPATSPAPLATVRIVPAPRPVAVNPVAPAVVEAAVDAAP